jgi:hypothetical protein
MRYTIATALILLCSCGGAAASRDARDTVVVEAARQVQNFANPAQLFSVDDAEEILGETARLQDSSTQWDGKVVTYRCTYTTLVTPRDGKKKRVIYFLFEEYRDADDAHTIYSGFKKANQNHSGLETINLGDEAYFHSDGKNFYFVMARKGRRMFRIKATKIGSPTSVDGFNLIAGRIMAQL